VPPAGRPANIPKQHTFQMDTKRNICSFCGGHVFVRESPRIIAKRLGKRTIVFRASKVGMRGDAELLSETAPTRRFRTILEFRP